MESIQQITFGRWKKPLHSWVPARQLIRVRNSSLGIPLLWSIPMLWCSTVEFLEPMKSKSLIDTRGAQFKVDLVFGASSQISRCEKTPYWVKQLMIATSALGLGTPPQFQLNAMTAFLHETCKSRKLQKIEFEPKNDCIETILQVEFTFTRSNCWLQNK